MGRPPAGPYPRFRPAAEWTATAPWLTNHRPDIKARHKFTGYAGAASRRQNGFTGDDPSWPLMVELFEHYDVAAQGFRCLRVGRLAKSAAETYQDGGIVRLRSRRRKQCRALTLSGAAASHVLAHIFG
ncbi:MAG TPA: hypothetical protein VL048_03810 [Xanthobacteraceae bacterium]|nr:hypothetical protein [Xanthobacteraceae bacterium]